MKRKLFIALFVCSVLSLHIKETIQAAERDAQNTQESMSIIPAQKQRPGGLKRV